MLAFSGTLVLHLSMSKTATVHTRIDPKIKERAESILGKLGMKPSEAIQIFYQQIALRRAFPVELKIPNEQTKQTLEESRAGKNLKSFSTKEALFEDLGL
jgi:DNA-damage-inducible protein J